MTANHSQEVSSGERFQFGKNWRNFLPKIDEERILRAQGSLRWLLKLESLEGKTFLDIGCGSGLISLAARRLGASVRSFDFDPESVAVTKALRSRYFPDDPDWVIEEASALDTDFIKSLGTYDVVYSWGVLHHTGSMWLGLENAVIPVAPGGRLVVAIYNDQGKKSKRWTAIKRFYCKLPRGTKWMILAPAFVRMRMPSITRDFLRGKPFASWRSYTQKRGMSPWQGLVDWIGGYPFEVARAEEIFEFYLERGFELRKLRTTDGLGCNELVFERAPMGESEAQTSPPAPSVAEREVLLPQAAPPRKLIEEGLPG